VVVQGMPQFQSQVIWCKNDLVKHECKDTKNYRPFNFLPAIFCASAPC
jgi:hypothetical protein